MRITSKQLRQIIREEASLLLREAKAPKAKVKRAPPPAPTAYEGDALLVYQDDDCYLEYFVGTEDSITAFVSGETGGEPTGLKAVPSIGNDRAWDSYNNGGPHPVAKWLKKHGSIKKIMDQDYPDPFGSTEFFNVADWIAEKEDAEFEG